MALKVDARVKMERRAEVCECECECVSVCRGRRLETTTYSTRIVSVSVYPSLDLSTCVKSETMYGVPPQIIRATPSANVRFR
jgi:hypothetical protein